MNSVSLLSCFLRLFNEAIFADAGGHEIEICDKTLNNETVVGLAQQMANLPELQSLTFENNVIKDEDAVCALLSNLRGYDRLENLNIRQNNFNFNIVNALAQGIGDKRELRVSGEAFAKV